MKKINDSLLKFFAENYKPGSIGLVGTTTPIGLAIREAQRAVTSDGGASLWSHCFLLGNLRFNLRGSGGTRTKSPYIFESDLKVKLFEPQIRNGIQENWVGKWCIDTVENAAVMDFGISDNERDAILAAALQLVDEQVLYPLQELLGTWCAIIANKQWKENPLDDPHAMYCSSFVRYCYRVSHRDFMDDAISVSNTTPENIAQAGIRSGATRIYEPPGDHVP